MNVYATDDFKKACETARDFYNKGYIRPDVLTTTDQIARMSEGKTFVMLQPVKPGKVQELFKNSKYDFAQTEVTPPRMDYRAGTGSMQAVSATSKNPARVMRFLNILNTDPYVKNLVIHGVEDKHYTKIDEKTVKPIDGSGYNLYDSSWSIGNVFLDYILENEDPNKHEQLLEYNKRAEECAAGDFITPAADAERKQRQTEISNAVGNYEKQLTLGAVDVEPTLKEFLSVLDKAGIEEDIKYVSEQYDKYLADKK